MEKEAVESAARESARVEKERIKQEKKEQDALLAAARQKARDAERKVNGLQRDCERIIKDHLNDPDSAVFEDARFKPSKDKMTVFIQVRAKNGFGGYVRDIFQCESVDVGPVYQIKTWGRYEG
jgi:cob(I)alamin adenosyltransferase